MLDPTRQTVYSNCCCLGLERTLDIRRGGELEGHCHVALDITSKSNMPKKSARLQCRKCSKYIQEDELRLALMLQDMGGLQVYQLGPPSMLLEASRNRASAARAA